MNSDSIYDMEYSSNKPLHGPVATPGKISIKVFPKFKLNLGKNDKHTENMFTLTICSFFTNQHDMMHFFIPKVKVPAT